ncbi:MAG TPA: BMP family ABC transporter substrate-binding protein, partial [Rubrivivax sp.]|nr:BMP family ABC transporter substrate-binding protein [Rubrivivax sp.]
MTHITKRRLLQVGSLTALAASALLVGCGKKEEPKPAAAAAPAPASAPAPKPEPLKIAF